MTKILSMPDQVTRAAQVAANVRAEMARRRWSGNALARQIGWAQSAMSRRLTAAIPFNVDELDLIARTLGVPFAALVVPQTEAPHPDEPGGADASRLTESNRRPIHYKDRTASVTSLADQRARREAAAAEREEARA